MSSGHHGSHDMGASVRAHRPHERGVPLGRGEGDIAAEAVAEDDRRPVIDDGDQVLHLLVDTERWPDPHGAPVAAGRLEITTRK